MTNRKIQSTLSIALFNLLLFSVLTSGEDSKSYDNRRNKRAMNIEYDPHDDWEIVRTGKTCGSVHLPDAKMSEHVFNFDYKGSSDLVLATTTTTPFVTKPRTPTTEEPPLIKHDDFSIVDDAIIEDDKDTDTLLSELDKDDELIAVRAHVGKVEAQIDNNGDTFEVEKLDKSLMVFAKDLAVELLTWEDQFTRYFLFNMFDEYAKKDNESFDDINGLKGYFRKFFVTLKDFKTQLDDIDDVWEDIYKSEYYLNIFTKELEAELKGKTSDGTIGAIYDMFIDIVEITTFPKSMELLRNDILTLNWILDTVYVSQMNETNLLKILTVIDTATDLMYLARINNKVNSQKDMKQYLDELIKDDNYDAVAKPLSEIIDKQTLNKLISGMKNETLGVWKSIDNTETVKTVIVIFGIWDKLHNLFEKIMLNGLRNANFFDFPGLKYLRVWDVITKINRDLRDIASVNFVSSGIQIQLDDTFDKINTLYLKLYHIVRDNVKRPEGLSNAVFNALWHELNHITKFKKDTRFDNIWQKIEVLQISVEELKGHTEKAIEGDIVIRPFKPRKGNYKHWNKLAQKTKLGMDVVQLYQLEKIRYGMGASPNLHNTTIIKPALPHVRHLNE